MSDPSAPSPTDQAAPRSHLLIAGTGRSGTSLLVRLLTELGMDTHLTRRGDAALWYDEAGAGLEDEPLMDTAAMPDVIKSPSSFEFIAELLAHPAITLRAAIVPVRDLTDAATSRTVSERQHIHRLGPWMAERERLYGSWCHTPGGVVFSLATVDQARLLAVGFHELIERLAAAEIPVLLPAFPRFVRDPDYLWRTLRTVLPDGVTAEALRAAHARVVDPARVRVRVGAADDGADARAAAADLRADRLAMARELRGARDALAAAVRAADARVAQAEADVAFLRAEMRPRAELRRVGRRLRRFFGEA